MDAASIKVQAETKRALDLLQGEVTSAVGRKVTLQEVAAVLARMGLEERERVIAAFEDRPPRASPGQLRRLLRLRIRGGPPTDAADLDDLIYGAPHGRGRRGRR